MKPQAIIFDLDGVITDTAHLHFMAWKQIADEMGIVIDEAFNDGLKGISRMASLQRILRHGGKEGTLSESECLYWASRKNAIYVNSLRQLTPHSVLPGIRELLNTLTGLQIPTALASVSLNAPAIFRRLILRTFLIFAPMRRKLRAQSQIRRFLLPPVKDWGSYRKNVSVLKTRKRG